MNPVQTPPQIDYTAIGALVTSFITVLGAFVALFRSISQNKTDKASNAQKETQILSESEARFRTSLLSRITDLEKEIIRLQNINESNIEEQATLIRDKIAAEEQSISCRQRLTAVILERDELRDQNDRIEALTNENKQLKQELETLRRKHEPT